jgi:hypothetical protein
VLGGVDPGPSPQNKQRAAAPGTRQRKQRSIDFPTKKALGSAALNTAEGERQRGGKGRNRFDDAMGSTDETRAAHRRRDRLPEGRPGAPIAEAIRIAKVLCALAR